MPDKIIEQIKKKINKLPKGKIFFITDFSEIGNDTVVRQSLRRLAQKNMIIRLSQGVYYYPKRGKLLGIEYPTTEQIAEAIAKRDKARIIPTGSYALYKLGLSTQIPMNIVYLTDGSARKVNVGNREISLKKTSPKNLAVKHKLSNLIIQGLREIGEKNITSGIKSELKKIIKKSGESEAIKKEIQNAPVWIQKITKQMIREIER